MPTTSPEHVIAFPAPPGEAASSDFAVSAHGKPIFVHAARVRAEILRHDGLWTHKPDYASERAAFAIFDLSGPADLTIAPTRSFKTATVLPRRLGIVPTVKNGKITLRVDRPRHLTIILDDSFETPLHLFIGEPEQNVPKPSDPNVVYFGPGVHDVTQLALKGGQTLYLAGGAILRAKLEDGEKPTWSEQWKVNFYHGAVVSIHDAKDVTIRGRGIIDAAAVPHPGRSMISLKNAQNVRIEGVTLRNASNWNVPILASTDVHADDVRIISARLNTDGINPCNSSRVKITRCFIRNHDDGTAVKTMQPEPASSDILVEDCTYWADWGYAMGVTYETRANITGAIFRRNDVLCARHWAMGVHLSDGATVRDIRFENITLDGLAESQRCWGGEPTLFKGVITSDVWGHDPQRGHVEKIRVSDVLVEADHLPRSELNGADADHAIRDARFSNIRTRGSAPATSAEELKIQTNEYVIDLKIDAKE